MQALKPATEQGREWLPELGPWTPVEGKPVWRRSEASGVIRLEVSRENERWTPCVFPLAGSPKELDSTARFEQAKDIADAYWRKGRREYHGR
jgi:hypothetical protein